MHKKYVAPAVGLSAFNCPHCGTLTSQTWFQFFTRREETAWNVWRPDRVAELRAEHGGNDEISNDFWLAIERQSRGEVFVNEVEWESRKLIVQNLVATECRGVAIWLYDTLLWPQSSEAPEPNADLPSDIVRDYREAGSFLSTSPRGAAALLRLAIQKLCQHLLGVESGKSVDNDIGMLVSKGLDVRVQRALDIVRVIGNEAVHPGTMDISDDRSTAEELFRLVNLIAETMITQPRHIEEMYSKLPEEKRKAIERRDAPRPPKS